MFFTCIKQLLQRFLAWLTPLSQKPPEQLEAIQSALKDWQQALYDFNYYTGAEMIDYAALNIKTAERRYISLLQQARREGLTAWPGDLNPPCPNQPPQPPTPSGGD